MKSGNVYFATDQYKIKLYHGIAKFKKQLPLTFFLKVLSSTQVLSDYTPKYLKITTVISKSPKYEKNK